MTLLRQAYRCSEHGKGDLLGVKKESNEQEEWIPSYLHVLAGGFFLKAVSKHIF